MKKKLSLLTFVAIFASSAALAGDMSASLDITGVVKPAEVSCQVKLSESSISILEESDTLIKQGENATSPKIIHVSIESGEPKCDEMVKEGKIAYWFQGTADNADGTVLANALSDDTAAKGVGIGIFDGDNKPLAVNNGRLTATEDTVFGLQMVQLTNQEPVAGNINSTVTVQIERL
ncbi:fimbrial protein [Cronobacter dublinensis]|uniref:fimbrial protein n=1 Tax=Cronobacter dublinensis TaxID=413497 RepID=UPI000CFE0ED1|nr:fimbrial protein [Cronobacter dublinensis]MDK1253393.1 fimbrial protein [Cronobacter dublinensis]